MNLTKWVVLLTLLAVGVPLALPKYLLDVSMPLSYEYYRGKRYISDSNYSQIIDSVQGSAIAVVFTLKACLSCHANEPDIELIIKELEGRNVSAYRCELQSNP